MNKNLKVFAVALIENINGELLLLNRCVKPLGFCLPGGGVDLSKESLLEGISREVFEEIGVRIPHDYFKLVGSLPSEGGDEVYLFSCNYKIDRVILSKEHSGFMYTKNLSNIPFAGNTKKFIKFLGFKNVLNKEDIISFGKYKGRLVKELPINYLKWACSENIIKLDFEVTDDCEIKEINNYWDSFKNEEEYEEYLREKPPITCINGCDNPFCGCDGEQDEYEYFQQFNT